MKNLDIKTENLDGAFKKVHQQVIDLGIKLNDSIKLLMIGGGNNKDIDSALDERLEKEIKNRTDIAI